MENRLMELYKKKMSGRGEDEEGEVSDKSSSQPRSALSIGALRDMYGAGSGSSSKSSSAASSYMKKAQQDLSCASDTVILGRF
eukprot:CAMPEP_0201506954 /NCGR_PEP_ID=MMETSP0161_2-20130828/780_1 /ASSEMBLY_ACC=CAM_ASM_000251 /TAXON_ID=180227 /ORGANISM="Neoparamoeba aestuarina, Strain SoJaBio B1-5/56/2" /LENGTH=82 /DNA_ID=CAMNT_0047901203 /DNA_START=313 /DNA_END=561 /DNA_ORIENTATION=-